MRRGSLIVFEGLDRTGKSTLATKLVHRLNASANVDRTPAAHYVKFPDRTTQIGHLIDEYLKQNTQLDDHAIHLLYSANRWELKSKMCDLLHKGTTLIVDRYSYSGIAYSVAKKIDGLTLDYCRACEIGLPRPDLVVFLTMRPECQRARQGFGDERYEKTEFQNEIAKIYESLRQNDSSSWMTVDVGDKSPEDLLAEIINKIESCIEISATKPIGSIE